MLTTQPPSFGRSNFGARTILRPHLPCNTMSCVLCVVCNVHYKNLNFNFQRHALIFKLFLSLFVRKIFWYNRKFCFVFFFSCERNRTTKLKVLSPRSIYFYAGEFELKLIKFIRTITALYTQANSTLTMAMVTKKYTQTCASRCFQTVPAVKDSLVFSVAIRLDSMQYTTSYNAAISAAITQEKQNLNEKRSFVFFFFHFNDFVRIS